MMAKQIVGLQRRDLTLTGQLQTRLDFEIDRLLRLDVNKRGEDQGALLLTPRAPDLVELETAEAAETPNIARLRELILHASTSAFAIAGTRGIGKSTLIRALAADRTLFDVAAVVPAPVRYDPDALLRRIHSDLALAILRRHGAEDLLVELEQSVEEKVRSRRFRLAAAAIFAGFMLFVLDLLALPFIRGLGSGGALGILLAFGAYVMIMNPQNTATTSKNPIVENAVDALETLRWSTEATRTAKTTFTAAKIFLGLEDTDSSTRKERDWSRPELVADLVAFIHRHLTLTRQAAEGNTESRRIAIAVDELDKLSDPDEILETINSLKDLFRIPEVHFLVSVSNDAMTRFALRGVVSRDAFDSSFDAVIELHRLTADESHKILSARAIGWPKSLSAVSHAWSGGLPRDLIRVARRCVELRRNTQITSIDQLSASIIAEDIAQTLLALRTTEDLSRTDEERSAPSLLTPLANDLLRWEGPSLGSRELSELLLSHSRICRSLHATVRAPTVKVLVGGLLTVAFAAAVSGGSKAMSGEYVFTLADELAHVNALQSEPLGEMLSAAQQALEHMERVGTRVPMDMSLVMKSNQLSQERAE